MEVLWAEVAGLFALDVHYADESIFGDEGNGELGANIGVDVDVIFGGFDVVEEDGLAGESDLANDSAAQGKAHAFGLGGVADLEAHAEIFGAVVEKEDGEDAVLDDGANELGGAIEEGLQVERGVERVGHLHEVVEVGGIDTRVGGVDVGVGVGWIGGAVIALELMVVRRGWRIGGHTYRRK